MIAKSRQGARIDFSKSHSISTEMRQADLLGPEDNDLFLGFQAVLFHQDFRYVGVEILEACHINCFSQIVVVLWHVVPLSVNWNKFFHNDYHFVVFLP